MASSGKQPYSTNFISGEIEHELNPSGQMKKYKKDERETYKAPNTLPYEMANLPQYFGAMVDSGMHAAQCIESLLKTNDVEHKKSLLKLKKNVEKMVLYLLQNVDQTLEKYTIGTKHAADDQEDAEIEDDLY